MYDLSIIVPNYNGQAYLKRCLDSIFMQGYGNVEVIAVDDGSTDRSLELLAEYKKHSNFSVVAKQNGGVSSARNAGIEQATGEFICFIDADDAWEEHTLDTVFRSVKDKDLLVFSYSDYGPGGEVIPRNQMEGKCAGEELRENLFYYASRTHLYSVCNKVYRRSVIEEHGIRFRQNVRIGEDYLFNLAFIRHIRSAEFINDHLYRYYTIATSAVNRVDTDLWKTQCPLIAETLAMHPAHSRYELEFLTKRLFWVYESYAGKVAHQVTVNGLRQMWTSACSEIDFRGAEGSLFYKLAIRLARGNHFELLSAYFFLVLQVIHLKHLRKRKQTEKLRFLPE